MVTLGDVLEHHFGSPDELTQQQKRCLQEILQTSLGEDALRGELANYFTSGRSDGIIEEFCDVKTLNFLHRGYFNGFIGVIFTCFKKKTVWSFCREKLAPVVAHLYCNIIKISLYLFI